MKIAARAKEGAAHLEHKIAQVWFNTFQED
jgi:hypothetical protein